MSYGINHLELVRAAASYVDRILRGTSPDDLPIQLPLRYELVINFKTAGALHLAVPNSLQLLTDVVIEKARRLTAFGPISHIRRY
jgi:putative ABC transport system substrate-binding protein